jgi:sporulation-control protein spo0M
MSAIQRLLARLGIGSAELEVALDAAAHPRGSSVLGTIRLRGGDVAQRIDTLTVALCQYAASGKQVSRLAECVPAAWIDVPPLSTQTFPFTLPIPDDAYLTAGHGFGRKHDRSGFLVAEADIRWAVNPKVTAALNIVPHREMTAIWEAMRQLGFVQEGDVGSLWSESMAATALNLSHLLSNAISQTFVPVGEMRDRIDHVTLTLAVERGALFAKWSLHRATHNLKERLGALAGADKLDADLEFPCRDLRDRDGKPTAAAVLPLLQRLVASALVRPDADRQSLLRGADSPGIAPDALLRPAGHAPTTRPGDLLRPSDASRAPNSRDKET